MSLVLHQTVARISGDCLAKAQQYFLGNEPIFPPFQRGQCAHRIVEALLLDSVTGNRDRHAVAIEAVEEWRVANPDVPLKVYQDCLDIAEDLTRPDRYLQSRLPRSGDYQVEWPWALDEDFNPLPATRESPEPEGSCYGGIYDRILWDDERGVSVHDTKTGLAWPKKESLAGDFQFRTYALAALRTFPSAPSVRLVMELTRHDATIGHVFVRGEPWEKATMSWLRGTRKRLLQAQREDRWPAQVGEGCDDTCPLLRRCEARSEAILAGKWDDDDLPARARLYLAAKKCASGNERALRKAADDDPIQFALGKSLGFVLGKRKKLIGTAREALEGLVDLGATDADIDALAPADRIRIGGIRGVLEDLAGRGAEIEDPAVMVENFVEQVPSATFKTYASDNVKETDE